MAKVICLDLATLGNNWGWAPAARQRRMNSKWDAQVAQNCVFSVFICAKLAAETPPPSLPLSSPQPVLPSLHCSASWLFSFIGPSAVADLILLQNAVSGRQCCRHVSGQKKLLKKSLTAWQQVEMTHREVEENKLGKYPSYPIYIYFWQSDRADWQWRKSKRFLL